MVRSLGRFVDRDEVAHLLSRTAGIDATATGETTVFTAPANKTAVIEWTTVRSVAADSITDPASAGMGVAAGADDVFPSQEMTGLTAADLEFTFPNSAKAVVVQPGQSLKFGIDVAATGTSQTLEVDVFGYLL